MKQSIDEQLLKLLDDVHGMGVDKGAGRWDDYQNLRPGVLKKTKALMLSILEECLGEIIGKDDKPNIDNGYEARNRLRAYQRQSAIDKLRRELG